MIEKDDLPKLTEAQKAHIGILGYGIVGGALANACFQDYIKYYDKDESKGGQPLEEVVKSSEFIFICLPTPMFDDESGIDLSIIEENIAKIAPLTKNTNKIVVIKSTVVPGTTEKFEKKYPKVKFCFNPEFLTEKDYLTDFINADRNIIGASNNLISRRMVVFYKTRLPHVPIFQTDPTTAEVVKYMANAYLATKVIFANQMEAICQSLGIKYEEVKLMFVADHRIEDSHLVVTRERGFGGKCFPKDMVALIAEAKRKGVDISLLETAWEYNKKVRQKPYDWLEIPFATSENHEK